MTNYTDKITRTPRIMWPDAIKAAERLLSDPDLTPETRAEVEAERDAFKQAMETKR